MPLHRFHRLQFSKRTHFTRVPVEQSRITK
jgi:hypothetical protein